MEEAYTDKIFQDPSNESAWIHYAAYLNAQGDKRGELLLLARKKDMSETAQKKLFQLISACDPHWVAQFETFEGKIRTFKEIEVTIETYGSAPRKYGSRVLKVSLISSYFLCRAGWELAGRGNLYSYVRIPDAVSKISSLKRVKIKIWVPTIDAIQKLATEIKTASQNKSNRTIHIFRPWFLQYTPPEMKLGEAFHAITFSSEGTDNTPRSILKLYSKEEFLFGMEAPYHVTIKWNSEGEMEVKEWFT